MRFRLSIILIIISTLSIIETVAQDGTSGYRVVDVIELGALSGPGATATFLSPDGQFYAHFNRHIICLYTLPENEEDSCYELSEDFPADFENVRWSPDGRYIAFPDNDALRNFRDADIQLLDLESGEIRNITDDGSDERFIMHANGGDTMNVDVALAWSEDNQLAVLRYIIESEETRSDATTIVVIDVESGNSETLTSILTEQNFLHTDIAWSGDKIAVGRTSYEPNDAFGIDIINAESGEIEEEIIVSEHFRAIESLQFSEDGNYLLVSHSRYRTIDNLLDVGAMDGVAVIQLSDNEEVAVDSEHFVTQAGFSPDRNAIAYTVYMHPRELDGGLYIASAPGEIGEQVLADFNLDGTTPFSNANLTWASNNTILVRDNENRNALLIVLEISK